MAQEWLGACAAVAGALSEPGERHVAETVPQSAEVPTGEASYSVRVLTQPMGQFCSVQNVSGGFLAACVVDITVTCN